MSLIDDFKRAMHVQGKQGITGFLTVLFSAGIWAVAVYRLGRLAGRLPLPLALPLKALYWVLFYLVQSFFGISIQSWGHTGKGFVVDGHGCIFMVAESVGENFTISCGVTVGNVRGSKRLPIIGNNVTLEPGVKVLGEVNIGDNVVIRANSLVLNHIPSNSIVVGNPARVTGKVSGHSSQPVKRSIRQKSKSALSGGPLDDLSEAELCNEN